MPVIELENVSRAFTVTPPGRVPAPYQAGGAGGRRPVLQRRRRARSSGTSARTAPASPPRSRCSPASSSRPAARSGSPAWTRPGNRLKLAKRIGVVFGQRTTLWWDLPLKDSFAVLQKMYGVPRAPPSREPGDVRRTARPRRPARRTGPAAVARPADARRHRGGAAARPGDRLPGRADDRPRRGQQSATAGVPGPGQRASAGPRSSSPPTTWTTSKRSAPGSWSSTTATRSTTAPSPASEPASPPRRTLIVDLATSLPPIEIPGTTVTKTEGPRQHLTFPPTTSAAPLVAQIAARYPLVDLSIADPTIESIIARLYAKTP